MDKVRIGLVGAGFAAHLHIHALRQVRGVPIEVVGVAAKPLESAEEFAKKFGIPKYYDDYRYLLDDKGITLIDICAPNVLHKRIALESIKAGKNVICEKPLTGYFGEDLPESVELVGNEVSRVEMYKKAMQNADEIVTAVKEEGVKFGYAENFVYAPAVEKARRLIRASQGTILELRAEESHSGSHATYARLWRLSGGGALLRLGSHPIGAVIHLKSYEGQLKNGQPVRVKSVTAEVANLTKVPSFVAEEQKWMVSDWKDVEDWAAVFLTFEDGTKAAIFSNDTTLGGVINMVEIRLSNAFVRCNITPNNVCQAYAPSVEVFGGEYITEKVETKAGWNFASPDEDWMRGYPQEMQDFVEALYYGREPLSSAELGRAVVQVVYASYVSAELGRRVDLDELEGERKK